MLIKAGTHRNYTPFKYRASFPQVLFLLPPPTHFTFDRMYDGGPYLCRASDVPGGRGTTREHFMIDFICSLPHEALILSEVSTHEALLLVPRLYTPEPPPGGGLIQRSHL